MQGQHRAVDFVYPLGVGHPELLIHFASALAHCPVSDNDAAIITTRILGRSLLEDRIPSVGDNLSLRYELARFDDTPTIVERQLV